MPLGIVSLGTVLRNAGFDVKLFDGSFDADLSLVQSELRRFRPNVVGISGLTALYENAKKMMIFCRQELDVRTVMGGPHPTLGPLDTASDLRGSLDYLVIGEGEETILDLMRAVQLEKSNLDDVNGIGFWDSNGRFRLTSPRSPIEPLDKLPIPDRDLLPTLPKYLKSGALNLNAIRGCPYQCSFCYPVIPKIFGKRVRYHSARRVVSEIEFLCQKYRIDQFFFVDDIFALNKTWLKDFTFQVKSRCPNIRYLANARCDFFDEEMAQLLKESGCWYVAFGVESGSSRILSALNKRITVEQIRRAFAVCHKHGLRTHAYLMVGSPGETWETLRETESLLEELDPDTVDFNITTPILGTELYERCYKQGILNLKSYDHQDYKGRFVPELPIKSLSLTYEDITRFVQRILRKRRGKVLLKNAMELLDQFRRSPTLNTVSLIIWRYKTYVRMKHMFG